MRSTAKESVMSFVKGRASRPSTPIASPTAAQSERLKLAAIISACGKDVAQPVLPSTGSPQLVT